MGGLVVVVGPAVRVAGRVVDEHGAAIAGVFVSTGLRVSDLPGFPRQLGDGDYVSWSDRSSKEGAFDLGLVPRHPALEVSAQKRGHERLSTKTTDVRGPVLWQLKSEPEPVRRVLTGTVLLVDGRPARGARLVCGHMRAATDEHGRFAMEHSYAARGDARKARYWFNKYLKRYPNGQNREDVRLDLDAL